MPKIEKKLLEWIDNKKEILFVIVLAAVGLVLRFPLRNILSGRMAEKVMATVCDYLLAVSVAAVVWLFAETMGEWRKRKAVLAFIVMLFSLNQVFSSAVYGYGDSLPATLLLWVVILYQRKRILPALCLAGLAVGLDLRALVILPFTLFVYFYQKDFPVWKFLAGGATYGLVRLADSVAGGKLSGWFRMPEYVPGALYMNTSSFWAIFEGDSAEYYLEYAPAAAITAVLVLLGIGVFVGHEKGALYKGNAWFLMLIFSMLGTYLFPGGRMGGLFISGVLAIIVVFFEPRTILPAILLNMTETVLYAAGLYGGDWMPLHLQSLSLLELGIITGYIAWYMRRLRKLDNVSAET